MEDLHTATQALVNDFHVAIHIYSIYVVPLACKALKNIRLHTATICIYVLFIILIMHPSLLKHTVTSKKFPDVFSLPPQM